MKNKKLSFLLLLILIMIFVLITALYLTFTSSESSDVSSLKSKIEEMDGEIQVINEQLEGWEEIKDGGVSIDIPVGANDKEQEKEEKPNTDKEPEGTEKPSNEEQEKPDDSVEKPKTKTYTTTASSLNVRSEASANAQVVGKLTNGSQVSGTGNTKNADGYEWIEVKLDNGKTGWAVSDYLK